MSDIELTPEYLLSLSSKISDFATSKDIHAAEVMFIDSRKIQIMCSGQSISTARETSELGFAVRVLRNNTEGFSYTNKHDIDSLEQCAAEAINMVGVSPPKPGSRFSLPADYTEIEGIFSKNLADTTIDEIIVYANEILKPFQEAPIDIKTELSTILISETCTGIVNSLGVEGFYKTNAMEGGFIAIAREGEKVGSVVMDDFFTRDPSTIDFRKFGQDLCERAIRNIRAEKATGIESDIVVFEPNAVFNPIYITMAMALAADKVQRNQSMWKDKLADTVAVKELEFVDDPHTKEAGTGARVFDDEGVPTQKIDLIKDGVLENFIFDELTASRAQTLSTGNSFRGQGGSSFMNPPNFIFTNGGIISPGKQTPEELIEDIKKGITFEYFSGSITIENGIFSGVAKGAQLIKNGSIEKPLTNVTISGNVFDVLNNIEGFGNNLKLVNAIMRTPSIRVKGITISTQK